MDQAVLLRPKTPAMLKQWKFFKGFNINFFNAPSS